MSVSLRTCLQVADGADEQFVLHRANLGRGPHQLADIGLGGLGGNLAGQQDDAIEAGDVDVEFAFEALVDGEGGLVLDDFVVELRARRTTICGDCRGANDGGADQ